MLPDNRNAGHTSAIHWSVKSNSDAMQNEILMGFGSVHIQIYGVLHIPT